MKDDRLYVIHVLECIARIQGYTTTGRDGFMASPLVQDAVLRNLHIMAESIQHLSEGLKSAHPEMDWRRISGFRNVLVHDYFGVDLEAVWGIVERDLPDLGAAVQAIAADLDARVRRNCAFLVVDVQNDFCPGGALAVEHGDEVVPVLNRLMDRFDLVVTTQDWHPPNHISFLEQGGIWPPHCIAGTFGAALHSDLRTDRIGIRILKADEPLKEAYSGFHNTDLAAQLRTRGVTDIVIGGLTTDYCVKDTALDGRAAGFVVTVVEDACRAVNVAPDDGAKAIDTLRAAGVSILTSDHWEQPS